MPHNNVHSFLPDKAQAVSEISQLNTPAKDQHWAAQNRKDLDLKLLFEPFSMLVGGFMALLIFMSSNNEGRKGVCHLD